MKRTNRGVNYNSIKYKREMHLIVIAKALNISIESLKVLGEEDRLRRFDKLGRVA